MSGTERSVYAADPRIDNILRILVQYAAGDFTARGEVSGRGDEIDAIILGLNALADETYNSKKITRHYLNRIEKVMEVLLKYTVLDFSETLPISDHHDEIDAISLGLNTLAEELQTAREVEREQLEEIRESKEQIEVILNNAPGGVIVLNRHGKILQWNSKAEKIFGWPEEEMKGQAFQELLDDTGSSGQREEILKFLLSDSESDKQFELNGKRRSGQFFPAEIALSGVKNKGQIIYIAFLDDISQRKEAEDKLRSAYHHLEESNKELEAFTYSVSHDLRAPLRAIGGYSQIIAEDLRLRSDKDNLKYFDAIIKNTRKMGELIDDLLALSRYSRAELERINVNMNEVVATVIDELGRTQDLKKVTFSIADLPVLKADRNLITQVMMNLLSNAVKYSSLREHPEIEIGTKKEKDKLVYYVKDNGTGFDMRFYSKLFGVFQRLHDSSQFDGTGVGLAIVKRVIAKHNGEVWAESQPDKGSIFCFSLD